MNEDDSIHCSGSLVTKKLILTAGHCFAPDVQREKLKIVFGVHNLTMLELGNWFTIRKIKEVRTHRRYQWPKAYSDISIVEIDEEVTFSLEIFPVCLPDVENKDENHLRRQEANVVGFGPKDENSESMQVISQRIRGYKYCDKSIKDLPLSQRKGLPDGLDTTLICAQNW